MMLLRMYLTKISYDFGDEESFSTLLLRHSSLSASSWLTLRLAGSGDIEKRFVNAHRRPFLSFSLCMSRRALLPPLSGEESVSLWDNK